MSHRAATFSRRAAAVAAVVGPALDGYPNRPARHREQHALAARLRADAATLAPGWLGCPLDAVPVSAPVPDSATLDFVRVGVARPLDDAGFPVVLPLVGAGHLAIDADTRDPRVAGLLRSLVLRLLAAAPAGALRILTVDGVATFAPFYGVEAVLPPPATDPTGLRAVLDEAEAWVRRSPGGGTALIVVIGSLPELTEVVDLARIANLASVGPAARVHLVVAGWPPPPLTPESTLAPLACCTQITVRNPYAWVGDPPGASFGAVPRLGGRLGAPVYLDPDPPTELIRRVCSTVGTGTVSGVADAALQEAWRDYLAAAQRLDAVRRAPDDSAVEAARRELTFVRQRLDRLASAGVPVAPGPADLYAAARSTGGPDARTAGGLDAIRAALASARSALSTAERLTPQLTAPVGPTVLRNGFVYGGYALLAVIAEAAVFTGALAFNEPVPAIPGVLVMPLIAYILGWLTTGVLDHPGRSVRTPMLGAVICALALVPALVFVLLVLLGAAG
jgi:hypothetical protein